MSPAVVPAAPGAQLDHCNARFMNIQPSPTTSERYFLLCLKAADAEEETGGKWRAGDPAKSSRAFVRAIEIYNNGLQKHPKDADLAYNK
ncbi:unnamed protein product [Aureobasidium pullulans]|nr:unnamed protein product [Aureobasidium pullulans]